MKIRHQLLSFLLVFLLGFPGWSESDIVGNAVLSQSAKVRDLALTQGSTLYSGDKVSVAADGEADISLVGGDRLDVLGGSGVSLAREHSAIDFMVDRGAALFHTVPKSSLQAMLGDATIRGLGPAAGLIRMDSPDSAVVFASSGKLSITTEHDGNTLVLDEGQGARVTLLPPSASQAGTQPTGKGPFLTPKRLAIIALIIGGGLLAGLLVVAHHEHKPNVTHEITPFEP